MTDRIDALRAAIEELYKHTTGDLLAIALPDDGSPAQIEITRLPPKPQAPQERDRRPRYR